MTFLFRTVTAANGIYRSVKFQSNGDILHRLTLRVKRIRVTRFSPVVVVIIPLNLDLDSGGLSRSESNRERTASLSSTPGLDCPLDLAFCRELRRVLSLVSLHCPWLRRWNIGFSLDGQCCWKFVECAVSTNLSLLLILQIVRGGICERPAKDIYEGHRVIKTLNTGLITVINHHNRISGLMADLAFTHEVGHSLGAEVIHCKRRSSDQDESLPLCSTMTRSVLVMRETAISSCIDERRRVWKTTTISFPTAVWREWVHWSLPWRINSLIKATVSPVSESQRTRPRRWRRMKSLECSPMGYCGNRHVEENEECDCGFLAECTDPCCYPADGPSPAFACRLKPTAHCRSDRVHFLLLLLLHWFVRLTFPVHRKVRAVRSNAHSTRRHISVTEIKPERIVSVMFDASEWRIEFFDLWTGDQPFLVVFTPRALWMTLNSSSRSIRRVINTLPYATEGFGEYPWSSSLLDGHWCLGM